MSTLFYVSYAALWLLLLTIGVLLLLLYRHFGIQALGTIEGVQRDGLAIGTAAPLISGVTADGQDMTWQTRPGKPEFLVFASTDCEPCADVLPHVDRLAVATARTLGVTAVVSGPQEVAANLVAQQPQPPTYLCLAEDGSGAFDRYRVRVTPFAFVIGSDGRILAKGLCGDLTRLRNLLLAGGLEEEAGKLNGGAPLQIVERRVSSVNGVGGVRQ
jgi:hypothetical protein